MVKGRGAVYMAYLFLGKPPTKRTTVCPADIARVPVHFTQALVPWLGEESRRKNKRNKKESKTAFVLPNEVAGSE